MKQQRKKEKENALVGGLLHCLFEFGIKVCLIGFPP